MGKTLFHSELAMLCQGGAVPTTLTIKSGLTKSKFPEKPDYFNVELNGVGRYLQPETPQISADLGAHVGRMIVATFSGDREQSLMVIQGQQGAAQPQAQPQAQPPAQQAYQQPPEQQAPLYQQACSPDQPTYQVAPVPQQQQPQPASFEQQSAKPLASSDPRHSNIILRQGMNLYWRIWGRVNQDAVKMLELGYPTTSEDKRCAVKAMFEYATRHERDGLPYLHSVAEAMPSHQVWPESVAEQ